MTANRSSKIIVLSVIAALAALTAAMAVSPRKPAMTNTAPDSSAQIEAVRVERDTEAAAQQAYLDQRHGEQTTAQYVDPQQVLQDFRHSEQTTGHLYDPQQADFLYREGEWYGGVTPAQAYLNYRRGEWTGK